MELDEKVPADPLEKKWSSHRFSLKPVNPANKRKHQIIVVGTGLAGASAAGARSPEQGAPGFRMGETSPISYI